MCRIGYGGYNWSTSASESNVYYLDFYHNNIILNSLFCRSYGFPLRCLQE
ncbi:MAG: hypothetical protein K2G93_06210 [Rikenella sp.]|nr:hypothetical protein [Rikenella sp.]